MALMHTPDCEFGQAAVNFELPSTAGDTLSLEQCRGEKGTVIMFISNHCPYVKAIQNELVEDVLTMQDFGVNTVAIMPNDTVKYPEDNLENMAKVATEFNYPFPYLLDETQAIAQAYGAICTPDFFGYDSDLKLQYRGRLSATNPSHSATEDDPRELVEAMREIAETGHGPQHQNASMGCSIKWR